ncbi:cell envelope biogenesis protein OmpA [Actinomyces sp. HMSC08A09]|uniref:OmpA family protein n=1 Tax=Actinomyces sp. HMSC08A09 TaxID=1581133 RepID=UPI0008A4A98D|nr:OmpA family protein [Actinomyces sp. HMSC08A09]OFT40393.1 cell envelope biogenesis protein OmpA [Actinomyces sp. HMSC08A09]
MTKALISLPSLSLIAALALSGCSLSVGGGSSSQAQGQQTQASQAGSDSAGSAGSAQGSASASASGTAASAGQAVAGYEPGQIPPIPMISLPDLSLLTQSTGAFTPDLTRSITSQPGITVRPARCDASGSLVSGSTVLGGDGSMTTSSGTTSVTNNGDGSGTYSDGKVSITVNGDGSGTYSDDYLSVTVNGDGSGTYSNSTTGESITLDGKGSGTYSRAGVSITNNGDGSGTYSDGKLSITNNGDGSAIVNGSTISAKPVPKAGKVGTFPSIDAAKPVQSCGTVITLEDSVLFDFGSSELRGEASTTLTNLATVIKDSKAPKVQVQGHTDSVSDDAFNQKLSEQRAQAVSSALKSDGVAADLEAVGYGETKPVAPNENPDGSDNPAGRRLNRRVEVFVPAF